MKLGVNTVLFKGVDVKTAMKAIKAAGYDGVELSAYTVPTLTTLIQPTEELGGEAVRILLDMVEGRAGNRHVQLQTALRSGGSVRTLKT